MTQWMSTKQIVNDVMLITQGQMQLYWQALAVAASASRICLKREPWQYSIRQQPVAAHEPHCQPPAQKTLDC